jgi:Guanine nucleotide exchange factor in Golgi transport N-terminal
MLTALKVFNDLCLLTERQKPQFLRFTAIPQTFGLELIESILTNHADIFLSHPEQANVLRIRVMPFIIRSLSERLNFPTTVRVTRVLYVMLRRHLAILPSECEIALGLLTHMLDPDAAPPWKRALCMEVFRGIYAEPGLTRKIYSQYDEQEGKRPILKNHVAALVRLATEKPTVIGLGHQSTIPGAQLHSGDLSGEQAAMEAAGVAGIIGGTVGMNELGAPGISTQWSSVRVPCIDQLDKTEPPALPESYIYSLVLTCINNFSEGLAKFILPLTIPTENRAKKRNRTPANPEQDGALAPMSETGPPPHSASPEPGRKRSTKRVQVPVNPLTLETLPLFSEIKTTAAMVENCWPAILATCSTFLNAALDSEFYHSLVRSFQKFTHVAGLLRLDTPRDTFLTTLGKAAIPSNVLSANVAASPSTPATETQSIFKNAKGLLSADTFVSQSPTVAAERGQQITSDVNTITLTTRNLLCLRALLNLGIALGPTLGIAWSIILETLQQADYVIFASSRKAGRQNSISQKGEVQGASDATSLQANFGAEITAVETAASRMLESTVDFPNEAFIDILAALCKLLGNFRPSTSGEKPGNPSTPLTFVRLNQTHRRLPSISGVSTSTSSQMQEDQFALAKLGELASINMSRLIFNEPDASGWNILMHELVSVACSEHISALMRLKSAEVLTSIVMEAAMTTTSEPHEVRADVQQRVLLAIRAEISGLHEEDREASVASHGADIEVQRIALDALKSVLEQSGEALVSGWDIVFDIMTSVFRDETLISPTTSPMENVSSSLLRRAPRGRSPRLIRSSFSSLQLICSDFLSSLPTSCILVLVDTLFEFCSQGDDLNISLTVSVTSLV